MLLLHRCLIAPTPKETSISAIRSSLFLLLMPIFRRATVNYLTNPLGGSFSIFETLRFVSECLCDSGLIAVRIKSIKIYFFSRIDFGGRIL